MPEATATKIERRKKIEATLRKDEEHVIEWLQLQHDSVLSDLVKGQWTGWQDNKSFDKPINSTKKVQRLSKRVMENRSKAASAIRVVLAQMYQHPWAATFSHWSMIPCQTDKETIGVVDIARGTAFDSRVKCPPETESLGLEDEVYAAANGGEGTVSFDGEVVQKDGTAVKNGKVISPSMPPGWRQIALPTWRGYDGGDGHSLVPEELYKENPIRPKLAAYGLMTCYGYPGTPRRHLVGSERINPSWWKITEEEDSRLRKCVVEWMQQAVEILEKQKTLEEIAHLSNSDNWTKLSKTKKECIGSRSIAAAEGAQTFLKENGFYLLGRARYDWAISDTELYQLLKNLIYSRLGPIIESLSWMLNIPEPEPDLGKKYTDLGPNKEQFDSILTHTAKKIAVALCVDIPDYEKVLGKLAEIHLENGPRYF